MKTISVEKQQCSSCGICCKGEHHFGLILLPGEYEKWVQEKREDILQYIEQSVYGMHHAIIWKNLETGEKLDQCPFLQEIASSHYRCTIQDTKPKLCSMFWCAWVCGEGEKGLAFRSINGWAERARKLGYGGQC